MLRRLPALLSRSSRPLSLRVSSSTRAATQPQQRPIDLHFAARSMTTTTPLAAPSSSLSNGAASSPPSFTADSVAARLARSVREAGEDPAAVDASHRPFLLTSTGDGAETEEDWTQSVVFAADGAGLGRAAALVLQRARPIRVLVLYGSLRERAYSKLMAFEAARLLAHMGCDVRVYSPAGLPLKDDCSVDHPKVQELRMLMNWSEANFWCSPEQHGAITGIFKTMFDHIPLSTGSVRPTQGKICAVSQVNGGSQSFNAVNTLRLLGRWMRMFVIPNQSSLPKAWTAFTPSGRMLPSSNRDRLVDVCEELVKVSALFAGHEELFADRWSERVERIANGELLTQARKEELKKEEEERRKKLEDDLE